MKGIAPVIVLIALFVVGVSMITYSVLPTILWDSNTIQNGSSIDDSGENNGSAVVSGDETENGSDLNSSDGASDATNDSNATNSTNSTMNASFSSGGGSHGSSSESESDDEPIMIIRPECPDNYGLNATTVIFYYTDELHSDAMMPVVAELETEGYYFYKIDKLWSQENDQCFDLIGATPTFVCSGSKVQLVGEVDKATLEEFVINCS